ncbi:DNA-3-methyladenine glycosylase [Geomicrobium sp. JCM 19039]|uniref:DNA-3-methyladenine glycosylase n=1 Tax=Geomicrobium sp. JCM 19039 TaxID=1460636 RepID=UPI001930D515|nr:DNA-3-methyladenine glycosylase [Geomicrobium sp. JCM 19039]
MTNKNKTMFGNAGVLYVYINYGIHHCINVVTKGAGYPEGVLIRAVEPLEGLQHMSHRRFQKPLHELKEREVFQLTNGPGKLGQAFHIQKHKHNAHPLNSETLYLEEGSGCGDIATSPRIGIPNSQEAKMYPWRFFEKDNPYVSKSPKR